MLCATILGCSQSEQADIKTNESEPAGQVERPPAPVVSIPLVDRPELDAVVAQQKGRVVLVDCWATWCPPCVAQLPHAGEMADVRGGAGLTVVTLSFDEPEDSEQVRNTLEKAGIGSTDVITLQSKFGSSGEALDTFEITGGALPHYKLYDRAGKLRRSFHLDPAAKEQFTAIEIDAAVAELLAE